MELLTNLLKITVVIVMAGNLLDLGLRLDLQAALRGLRNVRFVTLSLLWGFVLFPALAYMPPGHTFMTDKDAREDCEIIEFTEFAEIMAAQAAAANTNNERSER